MSARREVSKPWQPHEIARFRSEWLKGTQLKFLAHEMGRSYRSLETFVRRARRNDPGNWPLRFRNEPAIQAATSLYLHESTLNKARNRAQSRGLSVSAYMRLLIERDT